MSVTGIVAALTAEARTLGPTRPRGGAAAGAPSISTLRDGSLLIISGMGGQAATQAAQALIDAGARGLLSFGLAGALDPALHAGAVLLPAAVTDGSGVMHRTCDPWRARLAAGADHHDGVLLSLTEPLTSVSAKSAAWGRTGAAGVDMESFAIATIAAHSGISFAVARVVVDTALDSLPSSVMHATDARGAVSYPRLLSGLLRSPVQIPALLRLSQRYRVAMQALRLLAQRGVGLP